MNYPKNATVIDSKTTKSSHVIESKSAFSNCILSSNENHFLDDITVRTTHIQFIWLFAALVAAFFACVHACLYMCVCMFQLLMTEKAFKHMLQFVQIDFRLLSLFFPSLSQCHWSFRFWKFSKFSSSLENIQFKAWNSPFNVQKWRKIYICAALCEYIFVAREYASILTFENGAKLSKTHTYTNGRKHTHARDYTHILA